MCRGNISIGHSSSLRCVIFLAAVVIGVLSVSGMYVRTHKCLNEASFKQHARFQQVLKNRKKSWNSVSALWWRRLSVNGVTLNGSWTRTTRRRGENHFTMEGDGPGYCFRHQTEECVNLCWERGAVRGSRLLADRTQDWPELRGAVWSGSALIEATSSHLYKLRNILWSRTGIPLWFRFHCPGRDSARQLKQREKTFCPTGITNFVLLASWKFNSSQQGRWSASPPVLWRGWLFRAICPLQQQWQQRQCHSCWPLCFLNRPA